PVSLDLFARASRHDMNLRRLHRRSLPSEHRRYSLLDAAHQFSRVTPPLGGRRLLAHARISRFFFGRTEVRRGLETRPLTLAVSATNPQQARKLDSGCRKRNRIERIRNIDERAGLLSFRGLCKQRV